MIFATLRNACELLHNHSFKWSSFAAHFEEVKIAIKRNTVLKRSINKLRLKCNMNDKISEISSDWLSQKTEWLSQRIIFLGSNYLLSKVLQNEGHNGNLIILSELKEF